MAYRFRLNSNRNDNIMHSDVGYFGLPANPGLERYDDFLSSEPLSQSFGESVKQGNSQVNAYMDQEEVTKTQDLLKNHLLKSFSSSLTTSPSSSTSSCNIESLSNYLWSSSADVNTLSLRSQLIELAKLNEHIESLTASYTRREIEPGYLLEERQMIQQKMRYLCEQHPDFKLFQVIPPKFQQEVAIVMFWQGLFTVPVALWQMVKGFVNYFMGMWKAVVMSIYKNHASNAVTSKRLSDSKRQQQASSLSSSLQQPSLLTNGLKGRLQGKQQNANFIEPVFDDERKYNNKSPQARETATSDDDKKKKTAQQPSQDERCQQ